MLINGAPTRLAMSSNQIVITTDDMIPILIYLIIYSNCQSLWANLEYIKHFIQLDAYDLDYLSIHVTNFIGAINYISTLPMEAGFNNNPPGFNPLHTKLLLLLINNNHQKKKKIKKKKMDLNMDLKKVFKKRRATVKIMSKRLLHRRRERQQRSSISHIIIIIIK